MSTHHLSPTSPPATPVILVGWLLAAWCLVFALVNVLYEVTYRFAAGPYADYASGLSVMNWLVVALKLGGAGIALAALSQRPRMVAIVNVLVWSAFSTTLVLYVAGGVFEAVGMLAGWMEGGVTPLAVGYLVFFALGAAGYGLLAASHTRRWQMPARYALLGGFGAPLVLGLVFVAVPLLLAELGVMPSLL